VVVRVRIFRMCGRGVVWIRGKLGFGPWVGMGVTSYLSLELWFSGLELSCCMFGVLRTASCVGVFVMRVQV
jgi:hypothetical protein